VAKLPRLDALEDFKLGQQVASFQRRRLRFLADQRFVWPLQFVQVVQPLANLGALFRAEKLGGMAPARVWRRLFFRHGGQRRIRGARPPLDDGGHLWGSKLVTGHAIGRRDDRPLGTADEVAQKSDQLARRERLGQQALHVPRLGAFKLFCIVRHHDHRQIGPDLADEVHQRLRPHAGQVAIQQDGVILAVQQGLLGRLAVGRQVDAELARAL